METSVDVRFAGNMEIDGGISRDMERFGGIDFLKTRYFFGGEVNASRRYQVASTSMAATRSTTTRRRRFSGGKPASASS